jgi:long-chain acyl-CoA synthetase
VLLRGTPVHSNHVSPEPFDGHLVGGGGRIIARLSKQLELALDEIGVSLPQYRLLGWLEAGAEVSAKVAERMAVTPPSITALVDGLVKRGYVDRRSDPADRRRLPLHLTKEGLAALTAADDAIAARLEGVLSHTSDRERTSAAKGLQAWQHGLDRAREVHLAGAAAK